MSEIVAGRINTNIPLNAMHPHDAWQDAVPIEFCADWQGQNPNPDLLTSIRALWSLGHLFLRFECHYHELCVFEDSEPNGRRDHLWDRDVVEAFLQPEISPERFYKEFEVSPNGMWVDLDIFPGGRADLQSGLQRSVAIVPEQRHWLAEISIPLISLTTEFNPQVVWGANFYRVEGRQEPRRYLAWNPTRTPEPNFHVPETFGTLRFG